MWMLVYRNEGSYSEWVDGNTYLVQPGEIMVENYLTEAELDVCFPNRPIRRAISDLKYAIGQYLGSYQTDDLVRRAILGNQDALDDLQDVEDYMDIKDAEMASLVAQLT